MASLFGRINEETPQFTLLKKSPSGYEIRRYKRQLRASITFDDTKAEGAITSTGFRELAGYIFGGNRRRNGDAEQERIAMTAPVMTESKAATGSEKIAMTAPVMTSTEPQSNSPNSTSTSPVSKTTMSFILPSKYQSVDDLPLPNDENVRIEVVDPYTVAALRFSGSWTPQVTDVQMRKLLGFLEGGADGGGDVDVKVLREGGVVLPVVARYNPPWTLPFWRTNEIMVPVEFVGEEM